MQYTGIGSPSLPTKWAAQAALPFVNNIIQAQVVSPIGPAGVLTILRRPLATRPSVPSIALSAFWWDVLCPALILMGVYWPLGVLVGILDTFHDPGLVGLIRVGEFFDALVRGIWIL